MVMSSHKKSAFRLFKKHIARFFTIIAIVIVSIGFMSGVGEVENKIKVGVRNFYQSQNISDFNFKSKKTTGFSPEEIAWVENRFGEDNVVKGFCMETQIDEAVVRIYSYNLNNNSINKLKLLEGFYPTSNTEVLVERKTNKIDGYKLGEKINVFGNEYTVSGIVLNPLIINMAEEPSFQFENEYLSNVIYIGSETPLVVNDVFVTLENRETFKAFSGKYEKEIEKVKNETLESLGAENVSALTLFENVGLYSLVSYAEKVGLIGIIFVIFFLLVTLLVVYSTMTRLLDEERPQIACLKTLGYKNFEIVSKYLLFALVSVLIGGIIAFLVGNVLTQLVYSAFNLQYAMPKFPSYMNCSYYLITFAIILVSVVLLTLITGINNIKKKPVDLLEPKMPKSGKKVLLEKIPFIWNKFSFKYKSTFRNVFLFKSRFFMTIVSIIGATVLVFAGLGLMDNATKIDGGSSLITISIALIIFSAVLCALVIYNLTNINISERTREIATLMVLGYHNREVTGYIFREIYIMSIIGALLGIPFGYLFIEFVFGLINFGSVSEINWWTWLLTPIITVLFSVFASLLLRRKILKTDMNASLKSL